MILSLNLTDGAKYLRAGRIDKFLHGGEIKHKDLESSAGGFLDLSIPNFHFSGGLRGGGDAPPLPGPGRVFLPAGTFGCGPNGLRLAVWNSSGNQPAQGDFEKPDSGLNNLYWRCRGNHDPGFCGIR